jgi:WD40 repeat protein
LPRELEEEQSGEPVELDDSEWEFGGPLGISPDGRRAIAKLRNGPVVLWEFAEHWSVARPLEISENVSKFIIAGDGSYGIAGGRDGVIGLWDLNKRKIATILGYHQAVVEKLEMVRLDRFVSISEDGAIFVWDIGETGITTKQIGNHSFANFAFSGDGKWMLSAECSPHSDIHTPVLWDLDYRTKTVLLEPPGMERGTHIGLNRDGLGGHLKGSSALLVDVHGERWEPMVVNGNTLRRRS